MGVVIGYGNVKCPKCGLDNNSEKVVYYGGDLAYCKNCKSTFSRVLLTNTPEIKNDDPDFVKCPNCGFPTYRIKDKKSYNCQKCKHTFINEEAIEFEKGGNVVKQQEKNIEHPVLKSVNENSSHHIEKILSAEKKSFPDDIRCPKCGSTQISANKRGFNGGDALVGGLLTGGIGLLAGTIGSNKIKITCLRCGHEFKPGDTIQKEPLSGIAQVFGLIWVGIVFVGFILFLIKCG